MKNVLVIGAGRQGKEHISELIHLRKVKIIDNIYVFDIDIHGIRKYTKDNFLNQLESIDEIKNYNIDFGIICTPNTLHKGLIELLIQNKIHILKEKPFLMNCKDAEVINKLSNENHIVIKCCQQREYNGLYLFIKNNINQIGKIIHINYNFTLNDQNQSWYWEKDKGGGVLYGLSWHCLYFFAKFFNDPINFSINKINGNKRKWNYDTDDTNLITLKYSDGMSVSIFTSVVSPIKGETIEIHGKKGSIFIDRKNCYVNIGGEELVTKNIFNGGYREQLIDFINLIDSKVTFMDNISLKTVKFLDNLNK